MTIEQLQCATRLLENIKEAQLNKEYINKARKILSNSVAGIFVNSNVTANNISGDGEENSQFAIILPTEIVNTLLDVANQYYDTLEKQCTNDFTKL